MYSTLFYYIIILTMGPALIIHWHPVIREHSLDDVVNLLNGCFNWDIYSGFAHLYLYLCNDEVNSIFYKSVIYFPPGPVLTHANILWFQRGCTLSVGEFDRPVLVL